LSDLKLPELSEIMRKCGLVLGVGKVHKVQSLSAFIQESQSTALERYTCVHKRKPRKIATAHKSFVPDEVVSIDMGFRNLAFAHVSRSGKVLEWRRVELLEEAAFEPWVLAKVVEQFVRDILPVRPADRCTYIVEHQRFRSQGSAAVTNSVMVNNLIEALLYANLRHSGARIEAINPTQVSTHWRLPDTWGSTEGGANEESLPAAKADEEPLPAAKAGRGRPPKAKNEAVSAKAKAKSKQVESISQTIVRMDRLLKEQKQITSGQHDAIIQALGGPAPKKRTVRPAGMRDIDELQQKGPKQLGTLRDLRRRLIKKERTIALVQSWMLASLTSKSDQRGKSQLLPWHAQGYPGEMWPFGASQDMEFSEEMCRMFYAEKKKDDLCDCIIQAVAWLRWQHSVVDVLDEFGCS
ncbi:hypothetical protein IWW50_005216, partial [Coemansia erecta]